MIASIKHVSIPIHDQDRALQFYTEQLGFSVVVDAPMGEGQRWIKLSIPDAETQVILFTFEGHEDRIGTPQNIVFATHDVQKTYEELLAKGVEFVSEPQEEAWGTFATFKDTEGNQFVLSSVA